MNNRIVCQLLSRMSRRSHSTTGARAALLSLVAVVAVALGGRAAVADSGWTDLVPSADSRIIYVSDSEGSDSNDGMSPQTPVKTVAKGYSLLRSGRPDWMLLKRGDTFVNQVLHTSWGKSGRSADEPMVISSYGTAPERPKILSPSGSTMLGNVNGSFQHIAFVGLHLEPNNRQPNESPRGIRWLAGVKNLLIEDCYIGNFRTNIIFQSHNDSVLQDIRIRRSVIVDAWATNAHAQGIYTKDVNGLLIEECVFDHNGWHPTINGAHATIYNHNMYLQRGNTNITVRGNIVARGSATGVQQRPGGLNENNLYLRNPTNLLFGQFQNSWPSESASGTVRNNVVLDAQDIDGSPRGFGIWFQQVDGVEAYGNVVARHESGSGNINGIFADYNYHNLSIRDNVVYDWKGGRAIRFMGSPGGTIEVRDNVFQQPNNSDLVRHDVSMGAFTYSSNTYHSNKSSAFSPGSNFNGWLSESSEAGASWGAIQPLNSCDQACADLETYLQCIGYEATFEAFLEEARKQSRMNWRPEFTADAVNGFIRASYSLPGSGM